MQPWNNGNNKPSACPPFHCSVLEDAEVSSSVKYCRLDSFSDSYYSKNSLSDEKHPSYSWIGVINGCCADQWIINTDCWSCTQTLSINGEIEMFGLQGSPPSPTDPLFRQLSQDCPIRGLTMQTQRLLLACNLRASKREWSWREKEDRDTGCEQWSESWMPAIKDKSTQMQIDLKTLFICQMGFPPHEHF